jgi:hypothetical protein
MFSVPFEQIGAILKRSPEAVRQLASRARRRIRSADMTPDADAAAHQEEVVEAFLAPPPAMETSTPSSPCSIPTSWSAWTREAGPS